TSDLCGEKVSAGMVEHILLKLQTEFSLTVHFALLAPVQTDPPHYGLFLESTAQPEQIEALESHLENWLTDNAHYAYCRRLNQLGKVCIYPISNGWEQYQARLIAEGTRLGDIKPTYLDRRWGWQETFAQF
ncbi:MAG TPA: GH3 auxin-responsive promoter family protein, partial [Acidobacteriota bacterium]|nr:GH3 auxin-responsive promoter family protein [Acidobacteriota bacterium]